jgi:hypothetical protein
MRSYKYSRVDTLPAGCISEGKPVAPPTLFWYRFLELNEPHDTVQSTIEGSQIGKLCHFPTCYCYGIDISTIEFHKLGVAVKLINQQWKTFDFFEVSQIKPPDDDSASFLENNEISCVCSGSDNLFLGSHDGIVRILSSNFKVQRSFQAHDVGSITHMRQVEGTSLLVTIAVRGRVICSLFGADVL